MDRMRNDNINVFGSDFMPGKVSEEQDAVSHAMGRRWSGFPAHYMSENSASDHLRKFPGTGESRGAKRS